MAQDGTTEKAAPEARPEELCVPGRGLVGPDPVGLVAMVKALASLRVVAPGRTASRAAAHS